MITKPIVCSFEMWGYFDSQGSFSTYIRGKAQGEWGRFIKPPISPQTEFCFKRCDFGGSAIKSFVNASVMSIIKKKRGNGFGQRVRDGAFSGTGWLNQWNQITTTEFKGMRKKELFLPKISLVVELKTASIWFCVESKYRKEHRKEKIVLNDRWTLLYGA